MADGLFLNMASVFQMYFGKEPVYSPTDWAKSDFDRFFSFFKDEDVNCARNLPQKLFQSPTCGNGFVEEGEDCDCGLKETCQNKCCDPDTCKLQWSERCASGKCCDLVICRPRANGFNCADGKVCSNNNCVKGKL